MEQCKWKRANVIELFIEFAIRSIADLILWSSGEFEGREEIEEADKGIADKGIAKHKIKLWTLWKWGKNQEAWKTDRKFVAWRGNVLETKI